MSIVNYQRRIFWERCCSEQPLITEEDGSFVSPELEADWCARIADAKLAEWDKRWREQTESEDGE